MKKRNTFRVYILNIIGIILVFTFIWIRYIRERIPRDIPFNLSLLSLFILLMTCIAFLIIIKRILKPKPSVFISNYLVKILTPLSTLDNLIRQNTLIKQLTETIGYYLHPSLFKDSSHLFTTHIIFYYIPRFCLLILFIFDVFYLKRIEYLYLFMIVGIIPLLYQYLIHILRQLHKEYYAYIMDSFYIYFVPTNKEQQEEWKEEEGSVWDASAYNLEKFLAYKFTRKWQTFDYRALAHSSALNKLTSTEKVQELEKFYLRMPIVMNLEDFLFSYDFMLRYHSTDVSHNKLVGDKRYHPIIIFNVILNAMYLLCWIYILLVSLPNLHITEMEWILIERFQDTINPFNETILEDLL